jgi:hypothetical protein
MSTAPVDREQGGTAAQADPPMTPEPFPGLFRDDGDGAGTYVGRDGRVLRCTYREAMERAREDGIILTNLDGRQWPGLDSGGASA